MGKNDILLIIYAEATMLARQAKQTVGEKHDFYVTLEQLESIVKQHEYDK